MWCPSCKADVAAEVAADNRRVRCASCGSEIATGGTLPGLGKTREARDLLERWAVERKGEPASTRGASGVPATTTHNIRPSVAGGVSLEAEPVAAPVEVAKSTFRVDSPQPLAGPAGPEPVRDQRTLSYSVSPAMPPAAYRSSVRPEPSRLHRQHDLGTGSPHFDVQGNLVANEARKTNWAAVVGHLLAYAGVGLLTVGSTLVVWSYFGGPASYAPTGWLTSTAGQMLLFLGVVTLVSGGIEQTGEEVRTRIERIGERILRIEQLAREQSLRGPNLPAEYYAPPSSPLTSPPPTADDIARPPSEVRR